jgi:hypothetical protein
MKIYSTQPQFSHMKHAPKMTECKVTILTNVVYAILSYRSRCLCSGYILLSLAMSELVSLLYGSCNLNLEFFQVV